MSAAILTTRRLNEIARLERVATSWAAKYVIPTIAGDIESAASLAYGLGNELRGYFAVALWRLKIPVPAFREYFSNVWIHDHREVIEAAESRRNLRAMFVYAEFPIPDHLPEKITVWRGTSFLSIEEASRGYSWTTDMDCACWFAMRFAEKNGNPLVLGADVSKKNILFYSNDRNESEVVIFNPKPKLLLFYDDLVEGFENHKADKKVIKSNC